MLQQAHHEMFLGGGGHINATAEMAHLDEDYPLAANARSGEGTISHDQLLSLELRECSVTRLTLACARMDSLTLVQTTVLQLLPRLPALRTFSLTRKACSHCSFLLAYNMREQHLLVCLATSPSSRMSGSCSCTSRQAARSAGTCVKSGPKSISMQDLACCSHFSCSGINDNSGILLSMQQECKLCRAR